MKLYEAEFTDHEGKTQSVPGYFDADADAKAFFNSIAAKSNAKWTGLTALAGVTVPVLDNDLNAINTNFNQAADDASNLTLKGRCTFDTAVARKVIMAEIPSVKPDYLSAENRGVGAASPIQSGNIAKLLSPLGTAATAFRRAHFHEAKRRLK